MDKRLSIVNSRVNTAPVAPAAEENYEKDLFEKFMQQLPVWSYANLSKDYFISLTDDDKKAIISKYYKDMKSRRIFGGKKHDLFRVFLRLS